MALRPWLWPGVPWGVAKGHPNLLRSVQALSSQKLAPLARPNALGIRGSAAYDWPRRPTPVRSVPSPRYNSDARRLLCLDLQLTAVLYKGFAITARTFQIRDSGRWTLDLLIGRGTSLRAFSGPFTYSTEGAAITGCCEFARRIIDGRVRDCSVDDLT